jgi:glycosyltransferase involved in cell wall biosynthesis
MIGFWRVLLGISGFGVFTSLVFLVLVVIAAIRFRRRSQELKRAALATSREDLPAVTIFKPVHGMEERLEENLESFFRQDYPNFEIVIGARSSRDAAIVLAEKLRTCYPQVKSRVVVSGPPEWPNAKVFTLAKMIPLSRNDFFVISDSDVRVGSDFLRNVVPPLLDPKLGLVTCMYRGDPTADFWSSLEALGMSVEMPSGVVVADMLEGIRRDRGLLLRRLCTGQQNLGRRIQGDLLALFCSPRAYTALGLEDFRRSAAMDEEHTPLPSLGTYWFRAYFRGAVWDGGLYFRYRAWTCRARDCAPRDCVLEPRDSIARRRMVAA